LTRRPRGSTIQSTLTFADLLFLALFLAALGSLAAALAAACRHRGVGALRILRRLAMAAAVYLAVVFGVSWRTTPRVLRRGEAKCNGEWCIAVAGAEPAGGGGALAVAFRLFTTARRAAMRENDISVYLVDADGRRIEPRARSGDVPFNVQLEPGESVLAQRVFDVPGEFRGRGLVIRFGGEGFPGCFVIGENGWFHEPDVLLLD